MIGLRTRVSLGQLLERYEPPLVSALLSKYGGPVLYRSPGLIFGQQLESPRDSWRLFGLSQAATAAT